ncbi:hypothetical protein [Streptomyces lasiicapitis]|uniref:hypothetical protein n=1 Tax=Streptomyces lasiicapitis TaxID=1923961 RepID=UPI00367B135C
MHLTLRPTSRLLDRAPQGNADTTTQVTFHVTCDRRDEAHIRALLIQLLSSTDPRLAGLRIRRGEDEGTTALEAAVVIDGAPGADMEQLVTRLSLEPGVRDLHWHLTDQDDQARAEREALV